MVIHIEILLTNVKCKLIFGIEHILEVRVRNIKETQNFKYSIKWKGLQEEKVAWDSKDFLGEHPCL
jgi:hypothetical protein